MIKKLLAFVIIFLFIGTSIVSSTEKIDNDICNTTNFNGNLSGYVRDISGNSIEGALVRVYFHNTYEENYSDKDGYYHVTNIPICKCLKIGKCSKEDYKTKWILLGIHENTVHDFNLIYSVDFIEHVDETVEIPTNYHPSVTVEVAKEASSRGKIAYGFVAGGFTWGPCYFPLDNPGNITSLAPPQSGDFLIQGTWICDDRWFALEYNSGILWEIDPETGDMWPLGGGFGGCGLSFNPVNEKLYKVCYSSIVEINITTWESCLICELSGEPNFLNGIAFDKNGILYGWDIHNLWIIDIETCEATLVGPFGFFMNGDGHFDFDTNKFYFTAYINGGQLYEYDFDTGDCLLVGNFESGAEITVLAIPFDCENHPPTTPVITGPISGKPNIVYDFTFVSTDPENHSIKYRIDWDTGGDIEETDYYPSGTVVSLSCSWSSEGRKVIRAMAVDSHGAESDWSELEITIPRDKATSNVLFWRLLERFPLIDRILILERLLNFGGRYVN